MRFLSPGFIDVLRPFGRVGEYRHFIRAHFQEAAGDEEELLVAVIAHLYRPWSERGQQWDVLGQDAQLPLRAWCHHEVGIALEAPAFDGHDVNVQLLAVGHDYLDRLSRPASPSLLSF